jgi:voltage-gated potassium channel
MVRWRYVFGVAGVRDDEPPFVQRIQVFFEWLLLLVAIWLPFQYYMERVDLINALARQILIWIFFGLFLLYLLTMLVVCRRRWFFVATNWLTLLIIIVAFPFLWEVGYYSALAYFFRLIVIIFLLMPWAREAGYYLSFNRLWMSISVYVIISIVAGVLMSFIDPNIGTPWEGIWWSFQTISTLGYGDVVPSTFLGQLLTMVYIVLGVGFFAVLSASFTVYFFNRDARTKKHASMRTDPVIREIYRLQKQVERLEQRLVENPGGQDSSDLGRASTEQIDDDDEEPRPEKDLF